MDSYYTNQASALLYFSGHYRQRGSGFGALAGGIRRIALPIARKFILPAAQTVGKELLLQKSPELMDVVSKKNSKTSVEKHDIKYSQKANRRLIGAANETKTKES